MRIELGATSHGGAAVSRALFDFGVDERVGPFIGKGAPEPDACVETQW
jgi:hypothetical protein